MLFSEVSGRKVVSTSTADTVGKVDDFVIDPVSRQVIALHLKKTDSGEVLTWANISAVGADAVTVADAAAVTAPTERVAELLGKDHRAVSKRVLTTLGDEVGKVSDIDFDPATGTITTILVGDRQLPGHDLVGIGSYAVVIQLD